MGSKALKRWRTERHRRLDEFLEAHRHLGGRDGDRGRPAYLTRQINQAYLLAVAAQFQAFCRDLHSEASQQIGTLVADQNAKSLLVLLITTNRKLDSGNANLGNLGEDFNRLAPGFKFIHEVKAWPGVRNASRIELLEQLNTWRNAIAHAKEPRELSDQQQSTISGTKVTLMYVQRLRRNCDRLAERFEQVVASRLRHLGVQGPW